MKVFVNRFRWVQFGMWIGFMIASWALSDSKEDKGEAHA
jgi:hypothetical protein